MTTAFTPGPWTACFATYDGKPIGFHITASPHGSTMPLAECRWPINDVALPRSSEIEANGRLIAAAPDMYEALDMALMLLQVMSAPDIGGSLCGSARGVAERARAALVKAGRDRAYCDPVD